MPTLAEHYTSWVKAQREPWESKRTPRFYASALGGCYRAAVLSRGRYPQRYTDDEDERFFHDRRILHDAHVQSLWEGSPELPPVALCTEYRLTNQGTPRGFGGRMDALAHLECCDYPITGLRQAWRWMVYRRDHSPLWTVHRDMLRAHRLTVIDHKTVNPNITRWSNTLPKRPHVLQVSMYMMALQHRYELPVQGLVAYVPIGSKQAQEQYPVVEVDPEVVDEVMDLQLAWRRWKHDKRRGVRLDRRFLPPILPLREGTKKVGDARIILLDTPWECNYCRFRWVSCRPNTPRAKGGDKVGYSTPSGPVYVYEWCQRAQYVPPDGAELVTASAVIR